MGFLVRMLVGEGSVGIPRWQEGEPLVVYGGSLLQANGP